MSTLLEWVVHFLAWASRRPFLNVRVIEDNRDQANGGLKFEV